MRGGGGVAAWRRGWIKEWGPKFSGVSLLVGWSGGRGGPRGNFEKTRMQEKPFQVILQCDWSLKFTWIMPICRCFRGENLQLFHALKCLRPGALVGNQTVASSILNPGIFFRGDLVMKNILRPFSPFRWFKKAVTSCLRSNYLFLFEKLKGLS